MSDIATFIPQKPTARTEPNGWGVRGLDTNVIASAPQHTVDGTLLGATAQVRFTASGYRFDYGDGTPARATTVGGNTWAKQGLRAFDPRRPATSIPPRAPSRRRSRSSTAPSSVSTA
ncbi:hypothetical protein [Schumannella sp. 10F1B-5-1]|uniref:hypothetical protein n=1 Tax=Schumannella sp. 10F1B-5-1 TaxID=2590780 RepID=UPI0011310169|nr:hypothetical protein [Schumannella sp. 10F1B-5-1]TPW73073.1 hypothetical protein FJ658_07455 [Schumannella sp. 10F1B-5-1]